MNEFTYFALLVIYSLGVLILIMLNFKYLNMIRGHKREKDRARNSHYDSEYGLVTVSMFKDILDYTSSKPNETKSVAILSLNYSLGDNYVSREMKDSIFRLLILRLKDTLKLTDFIARDKDGTLLIMLTHFSSMSIIETVVSKLISICKHNINIDNVTIIVTPYVGIDISEDSTGSIDTLLANSKRALVRSIEAGKEGYCFYSPDIDKVYDNSEILISDLREALRNKEFILHYQPQYDLKRRKLSGAEALIRWQHPERGLIYPDKFILLAESNSFIHDLGAWVIEEVCRNSIQWGIEDFKLSLNVSAHQITHDGFVDRVCKIVNYYGVNPDSLTLEITETTSISDKEKAVRAMNRLKDFGFSIAIDDFGVGNSTLSYLNDYPVDYIKLDRSFILGLDTGRSGEVLLSSVLTMASSLGIRTIVEGVETKEHLDLLIQSECNEIQGYYLSKPISQVELRKFLSRTPYVEALKFKSN